MSLSRTRFDVMQHSHDVHEKDTLDWLLQILVFNLMGRKCLKQALNLFHTQDLLLCVAMCGSVQQCAPVKQGVMQYVALCGSVLQRAAVCCRVLHFYSTRRRE